MPGPTLLHLQSPWTYVACTVASVAERPKTRQCHSRAALSFERHIMDRIYKKI